MVCTSAISGAGGAGVSDGSGSGVGPPEVDRPRPRPTPLVPPTPCGRSRPQLKQLLEPGLFCMPQRGQTIVRHTGAGALGGGASNRAGAPAGTGGGVA